MQPLILNGINGHQLWGFMSALGSFSLLDDYARARKLEAPKMSFERDGTAIVHTSVAEEELAAALLTGLQEFQPFLNVDLASINRPGDFTRANFESIALASSPGELAFLAGLACVVGEETYESTLCAANGASHQNLVQSMRDVLKLVEEEHLRLALFETWRKAYRVPDERRQQLKLGSRKPTLRLDPADDRLYALRFSNPTTTDDFCTELGAQALAIPAYALLPLVPAKRPVTVASKRSRQRVTFSWPLWSIPATLRTTKSLVWSGPEVSQELRARGVFAAFSVDRVSGANGKLSFTPAQGLW